MGKENTEPSSDPANLDGVDSLQSAEPVQQVSNENRQIYEEIDIASEIATRPIPKKLIFALARHGRTAANRIQVLQGEELDLGLDIRGAIQAVSLAKEIKNLGIKRIITSKLMRSRQTGQLINKVWEKSGEGVTLESYDCFNERRYGEFSGKTMAGIWKILAEKGMNFEDYTPEGAETMVEFRQRVIDGFKELIENRPNNDPFIIICHGGVLNILNQFIKGEKGDPNDPGYAHKNASLSGIYTLVGE